MLAAHFLQLHGLLPVGDPFCALADEAAGGKPAPAPGLAALVAEILGVNPGLGGKKVCDAVWATGPEWASAPPKAIRAALKTVKATPAVAAAGATGAAAVGGGGVIEGEGGSIGGLLQAFFVYHSKRSAEHTVVTLRTAGTVSKKAWLAGPSSTGDSMEWCAGRYIIVDPCLKKTFDCGGNLLADCVTVFHEECGRAAALLDGSGGISPEEPTRAVAALFLLWTPTCGQCAHSGLTEDDFSRTQLAKSAEDRRCNDCNF